MNDRPATELTEEIEITPEMMKAGMSEYYSFNSDFSMPEDFVRDIWRAMEMVRRAASAEITDEMIVAGEDAIWSRVGGADLGGFFSASELAVLVFSTMKRLEPSKRDRSVQKNHAKSKSNHDTI